MSTINDVDLTANQNLNIILVPQPDLEYHTYSGSLKDQDGNPISPRRVTLISTTDPNERFQTSTDANGSFSITALEGEYSLRVGFRSDALTVLDPLIDLTSDIGGQDFVTNKVQLTVKVVDQDGNPVNGVRGAILQQNDKASPVTNQLVPGWSVAGKIDRAVVSAEDTLIYEVYDGMPIESLTLESTESPAGFSPITLTNLPTISEDTTIVVQVQRPVPPGVPQNLSASSPTNVAIVLSWNVVIAATSCKIFRDNIEIDISNNNSFVDNSLTVNGTLNYTVSACNAAGCSDQSDPIAVVYDMEAPMLGAPEWSINPISVGDDSTLTAGVTDSLSGVAEGEYFIGSDPGQGNGTSMTLINDELSATLGAALPIGAHTINVRARDNAGNWSQVTTTELIVQDVTPPVVDYILSAQPNANGWYNFDVTIDWQATDPAPSSGTPTDPPDTVAATEGENVTYTSDPSCDPAGNCATGSVQLSIDKTNPTTGTPTMSGIVIIPLLGNFLLGDTIDISAAVGDNLSGVVRAEYYFDTDPGQGNATAMDLSGNPTNNGTATATAVVSGLSGGQHTLYVRSLDTAGNWSTEATFTFARLF